MSHEYYADNQLYLEFLEISQDDIPMKSNTLDKQELHKIIEKQFRKLVRKYHTDYGGTDQEFKFLLDCKAKLLESNSGNSDFALQLNDKNFSAFDKNSLASKLGNQLFDLISEWNDLNVKPMYRPTSNKDEYEWIFNITEEDYQLCLNVQNLTEELAELSHNLYQDDSLSVLVCLFVPSKKFAITQVTYDNSVMLTFNDKILIESSNANDIFKYFSDKENIKSDLIKIKNGDFISKNNNELKVKRSDDAKAKDKILLDYLQNIKLFDTQFDAKAAEFLDKL